MDIFQIKDFIKAGHHTVVDPTCHGHTAAMRRLSSGLSWQGCYVPGEISDQMEYQTHAILRVVKGK